MRITDKMTYTDGRYFCNGCDEPYEGEELAEACFDAHEEEEGNREGCTCWGSNAVGHTDSDCPLGTG